MPVKIKRLSQYWRGWFQYFGIGIPYQLTVDLDQWIKRRVRMCYFQQWRTNSRRFRRTPHENPQLDQARRAGKIGD